MEKEKVLYKLQAQCSKKECCTKDIYAKALADLDGNEIEAAEIVASLVKDKFIDDQRYCEAFCREKAQLTGWGPVKISYMLSAKGMSKEMIKNALLEVDEQKASSKLDKLLEAKYKTVKGEVDEKFRLIKYALTRGYEYEDVASAVDALLKREKLKEENESEAQED